MSTFNATAIDALPTPPTGNKFHGFSGALVQGKPIPRGLGVVVTAKGVRSFVLNYNLAGRERRYTIGRVGEYNVPQAIERARELRQEIDRGTDPLAIRQEVHKPKAQATTVSDIFDRWLVSPHRKDKPSTYQRSSFKKHILPAIGDVPYRELRKSQVADMYDDIAGSGGPAAANRAITYLTTVLNWREGRDDDWSAPNLSKIKSVKEKPRDRVLSDDEIRALWPAWVECGSFGQLCRLLLLTGQRRSDMAKLTWAEIDEEAHIATIAAERYKTRVEHVVPLSEPAMAILEAIPHRPDGRVFSAFNYNRVKNDVAAKVTLTKGWTLHDLRRTAKTLMARAGVLPHISERVLGHAQGKIEGTYDQYDYLAEKRDAVDTLARTIYHVLSPEDAKVIRPSRFNV